MSVGKKKRKRLRCKCYRISTSVALTHNAEYNKRKIMTNTEELKQSLQEKAWKHATEILKDAGIVKEDRFYALRLYEMQFNIYRNLKMCFDIE